MKKQIKFIAYAVVFATILASIAVFFASSVLAARVPGDVNKDGKVNNKDVVALFRYVSNGIATNVDEKACDCNGDGKKNNKDVVYLFRYSSGASLVLHYEDDIDLTQRITYASVPKSADSVECFSATSASFEASSDGNNGTVIVTSAKKQPKIEIDLHKLANKNGGTLYKSRYLAVRFKAHGQSSEARILLNTIGGNTTSNLSIPIDYSTDKWQGVLFDLRDHNFKEDALEKLGIQFLSYTASGSIEIGAVVMTDDMNEALTACEKSEYCLNYDENLTDNDPLAKTVLTAENEDSTFLLWFDQSTEKVNRDVVKPTGRSGYTVKMAKNESENCQFFVAPKTTTKVNVVVDEFKNENGKTVPFELYYEFYHNINGSPMPDAIPPFTEPIEVAGGNSQGFIIQLTTLPETEAGTYTSTIHIYDADTGKEIKRAAVAVKVWNFELSDETELRTAFALWTGEMSNHYNWHAVDFDYYDVVNNYFYFFQKYRINIMDHPNGITSSKGKAYMSDPRTNTARWDNRDVSVTEDNDGVTPDWIDKVIYYPGELDEPGAHNSINKDLENMRSVTARIKANTPDYRMVIPFERNPDLTADGKSTSFASSDTDLVGYLSDYVKIWCPKLDAFTTRDLSFISRVSFLQNEKQDAKYGTFTERMKKEVAEGDELWTYICINPTEPYANWQILSDGTEAIVSMWQMKEYGITGVLYWAVNCYQGVNYMNNSSGTPFGDGILIYSGYFFGPLPSPVSSIRLESIRDGIEDYQMLCMLEDALGEQAAADMISRVTTSVVTYTSDDDYLHAVRVLLGDTLEAALNNN